MDAFRFSPVLDAIQDAVPLGPPPTYVEVSLGCMRVYLPRPPDGSQICLMLRYDVDLCPYIELLHAKVAAPANPERPGLCKAAYVALKATSKAPGQFEVSLGKDDPVPCNEAEFTQVLIGEIKRLSA